MENKSKLKWETFEEKLGSWGSKIYPFYLAGGFDPIYRHLKDRANLGVKILPDSKNTFRCFEECSIDNVRLIIVGMCPYHSLKNGESIADGLALSCGITKYPQPSLDFFTRAIEKELYNDLCLPCIKNPDLTYLANKEGVLLLNAGLTTEAGFAGVHNKLWEPFMKYLFENVLDVMGIPILLLGKDAQKLEKYIAPFNTIIRVSHPASAAHSNLGEWNSESCFKQIETILKHKNNETINWFDENQEAPF